MEPIHYLRALRRRWLVITAAVLIGVVAAFVTTHTVTSALPSTTSAGFQATTVLWDPGTTSTDATSSLGVGPLATIALLPDVAVRAAQILKTNEDPMALRTQVQPVADPESGFLNITGYGQTPKGAVEVSTAFSQALVDYLRELKAKGIAGQQKVLQEQLALLQGKKASIDQILPIQSALTQLAIQSSTPIGLQPIQKAVAEPVPLIGFRPPQSRWIRVMIAAIVGLLAGITIALVLERFDTKIRTRQQASDHFQLPVLSEVPIIPKKQLDGVSVVSHPTGKAADAFRLLGASVAGAATVGATNLSNGNGTGVAPVIGASEGDTSGVDSYTNGHGKGNPNGNGNGKAVPARRAFGTLLVTSPGPSDGKTTVAANLAAFYGELGWRVILVSCDLRRPTIHRLFKVPVQPGLAELLHADRPLDRASVLAAVHKTKIPNVLVLPSGMPPESPGELLGSERMRQLLQVLARGAELVILDCSPVLVASDVAALLPDVDAVLLVARAGKTQADLAERTSTVLTRLRAPVVGVALNGAKDITMPASYRRYYRPSQKELKKEAAASGF